MQELPAAALASVLCLFVPIQMAGQTWNRTDSLKEMTAKEYEACCTALEKLSGQDEWRQKLREELRRKRSLCLNLMQKLGIDTSDYAVEKF